MDQSVAKVLNLTVAGHQVVKFKRYLIADIQICNSLGLVRNKNTLHYDISKDSKNNLPLGLRMLWSNQLQLDVYTYQRGHSSNFHLLHLFAAYPGEEALLICLQAVRHEY